MDEILVEGSERLNRVRLDLLEFTNWHIVDEINSVWLLRLVNSKGPQPDGTDDDAKDEQPE